MKVQYPKRKRTTFCDSGNSSPRNAGSNNCQLWTSQNQKHYFKSLIAEILEACNVNSNQTAKCGKYGLRKRDSPALAPLDLHRFRTPLRNKNGRYQCQICQKEFSFGTNLTRHQRKFHGRPLKRKPKGQAADAAEKLAPILSVPVPVRAVAKQAEEDVPKGVKMSYTVSSRTPDDLGKDGSDLFKAAVTVQDSGKCHPGRTCCLQKSSSAAQMNNGDIFPVTGEAGDDAVDADSADGPTDNTSSHPFETQQASDDCKFRNKDDMPGLDSGEGQHRLKLFDMDANSTMTVSGLTSQSLVLMPGSQTVVPANGTLTSQNPMVTSQSQDLAHGMVTLQSLLPVPATCLASHNPGPISSAQTLQSLPTVLTPQMLVPPSPLASQTLPVEHVQPALSTEGILQMPNSVTSQSLPIPSLTSQILSVSPVTSQSLSIPSVTSQTLPIPLSVSSQSMSIPDTVMSESVPIAPVLTSSKNSTLSQGELVPLPIASPQPGKYQCTVCQQRFLLYRNLGCHLKTKHKMKVLDLEMEGKSEKYKTTTQKAGDFQCHLCCHRFTFSSNLRRHLTSHHGYAMKGRKHRKAGKDKTNKMGMKKGEKI